MFKTNPLPVASSLFALLLLATAPTFAQQSAKSVNNPIIKVDGNGGGRLFDGIGAVSAGGTTRLLIDYPKSTRSDILDYLFKPKFGAGFVYLKTEIGGDGNTTCGSEPSIARTREEMEHPNYQRGVEYWLMRQAANRNPEIELDALEWCMPGWFTSVWSMDNARYILKFIDGAKSWGLSMKYISGTWNEREYNRNWIVDSLKPLLNKSGYGNMLINAPEGAGKSWAICDELMVDTAFKNAIAAVSYHYPDSYMNRPIPATDKAGETAFNCGKPLWSGEDFSMGGGSWRNTLYMAKNIIKCYIGQKIVKVNLWLPVASMPDNACYSNTGIMKASSPWSGHYDVWPTIWAVAHFNQFVRPGWQYLDAGCGTLPGDGVYATYKAPGAKEDYTIVIVNGSESQELQFQLKNLSGKTVHVWKSDSINQFIAQKDLKIKNGVLSIAVAPDCIYSLTTTSGQKKGSHPIPAEKSFATHYQDDFNNYSLDQAPLSPKYFYDNSGAFELYGVPGQHKSNYLRQMVDHDITHWIPDQCAFTFVAQGAQWSNGSIEADVHVEEDAFNGVGYAGIIIRGAYDKAGQANIPHGYRLNIYKDGQWKLETKDAVLDSGTLNINTAAEDWHHLKLECTNRQVTAFIDQKQVASIKDNHYLQGAAGFVSGWNKADFDNLQIDFTPTLGHLVSIWKDATASSEVVGQSALNAVDGNTYTQWTANAQDANKDTDIDKNDWLVVDLGKNCAVVRSVAYFNQQNSTIPCWLSYSMDKIHWTEPPEKEQQIKWDHNSVSFGCQMQARYVRVMIKKDSSRKKPIGIYQFDIYEK